MTSQQLQSLAVSLYDIGAVKMGRFTLHSGKISPIYIDLRLLVSHPRALQQVAEAYASVLDDLDFDVLAAYPYAALPIGTAIALHSGWPLVYPRKTTKAYGTGRQVEGAWEDGQTAVVIEDLITSGDSILQAIKALNGVGLQVKDAVVLIDRQQGGRQALSEKGYNLHAVLTIDRLLTILEEQGRIDAGQRAEVLEGLG
ncbi:MAG: orotate phosphoribosyltransferase [Chloroflexota bacterium]